MKQASERIRENEEEELGRNELMPDSVHNWCEIRKIHKTDNFKKKKKEEKSITESKHLRVGKSSNPVFRLDPRCPDASPNCHLTCYE